MMAFIAGLVLGFVGSGHCAAMCGTLVLAAGPRVDRTQIVASGSRLLVYHLARIATYLVIALPAGLAGQLLSLSGFERPVAVAGASVLVAAAFGTGRTAVAVRASRFLSTVAGRICSRALPVRERRWLGPFAVGMANGLLPCGLTYAAAAASAGTGSIAAALAMMSGFGFGTLPALVSVSAAAASVRGAIRGRLARLAPVALLVAAVLILARAYDWPGAGTHQDHSGAHHIGVLDR